MGRKDTKQFEKGKWNSQAYEEDAEKRRKIREWNRRKRIRKQKKV